jgi:hypothetical protein
MTSVAVFSLVDYDFDMDDQHAFEKLLKLF